MEIGSTSNIGLTDSDILERWESFNNQQLEHTVEELTKIAPTVSNHILKELAKKTISLHQSKRALNGKFLEDKVVEKILEHIPHKIQVTIDADGIIVGFNQRRKKCFHIVDFVIGDSIEVGKSIMEFVVLSCKTTCRERWTQDDWSFTFPPRLYLLITISNDYPSSVRFREGNARKIITCKPKSTDDRMYKLGFNHLENEIMTLGQGIYLNSIQ